MSGFASWRASIADFAIFNGSLSKVKPFALLVSSVKVGSVFLICSNADSSIRATSSRMAFRFAAISMMFFASSSGRFKSLIASSTAAWGASSGSESTTVFAICI